MSKKFAVRFQDNRDCNTSSMCGTPGREALCGDETCVMPVSNPGQYFGNHTVNTSTRPSGSMSIANVEAHFTSKLQAAFTSLDKYVFGPQDGRSPSPPPELARQANSGSRYLCRLRFPVHSDHAPAGRKLQSTADRSYVAGELARGVSLVRRQIFHRGYSWT